MATNKATVPNIDKSDTTNFPYGRIKDDDGSNNGTPVNRQVYSDLHEFFARLMRLAGIAYNGLPDSVANGYQLVDAAIALAGKNDFITPLNTINILVAGVATDVISVPLALSTLKLNEALVCQAAFDHTDETLIKGTEPATQAVTLGGAFKSGDYIRFIKTSGGVTLVRLADDLNLDVLVTELLYLKATTSADEFAGTSTTAATTPYTNQLAFFRRVCGLDSGTFLASSTRNGLMSAAQWSVLASLPVNPVKNVGWFSGVQPGGGTVGSPAARGGNVVSAIIESLEVNSTTYLVTLDHAMASTDYFVRMHIRSIGTLTLDNDIFCPIFRPVSTTTFEWTLERAFSSAINLTVYVEVVEITPL